MTTPEPSEPHDFLPAELVLVQVADDVALAFGARRVEWLELEPLVCFSAQDKTSLTNALSISVGGAGAVANVAQAALAAQGLVQLTPATMTALQTMTPMVGASGANLGTLVDSAGKIGHALQWVPAGGASAVGFAASMGTSLALIAIQIQLAQISKKVDQSIELTKEVLQELRWSNEAEITALAASVKRAYREASAIGAVTPAIYSEISGKEHLLLKSREVLAKRITAYTNEIHLARSVSVRRKWLQEHADRSMTDLQALVQIHQTWYVFQALRAASIGEADGSERGAQHVAHLRAETEIENERVGSQVVALADHLQRQFGLLEEAGPKRIGRFKSAREARTRALEIRETIAETLPLSSVGDSAGAPHVTLGDPKTVQRASRMLRWLLEEPARPEFVALCDQDGYTRSLLFLTESELIITRTKRLFNEHELEYRVPLMNVRYVLFDDARRELKIATSERFFALTLPAGDSQATEYGVQLLQSWMNVPDTEVPHRPPVSEADEPLTLLRG